MVNARGELREDVYELLVLNVRHPRDFRGDLAAMIGSAHVGERRLGRYPAVQPALAVGVGIEQHQRRRIADRFVAGPAGTGRDRTLAQDAGLDLGKTEEQSAQLLRASDRLAELGYPVFLSASNKRFLWQLCDVDVESAWGATVAAHAYGVTKGCRILRAHDVRVARPPEDSVGQICRHTLSR